MIDVLPRFGAFLYCSLLSVISYLISAGYVGMPDGIWLPTPQNDLLRQVVFLLNNHCISPVECAIMRIYLYLPGLLSDMVLYLINPMKHRRERPVCRSGGHDVEPGDNHRRCPVDGGFGTAHRPFPTVIFEGTANQINTPFAD